MSMDEKQTENDKAMPLHDAAEYAYEQHPHFVRDKDQFLMFKVLMACIQQTNTL